MDCLVTCLVAALATGPAIAEDPAPLSFVRDIQPLLQARCVGCHQPAKASGEYVMTSFAKLLAGGENLDEYYQRAIELVVSGRARDAFNISQEADSVRDRFGRNTFGQSCLLARRLVEAGTRVVEIVWPKVANSDNHSWDQHVDLTKRMKNQSGPMFDTGLSALFGDLDERGMLEETLLVAVGEFGRSPQRGVSTSGNDNSADGRDHWPYCYTAVVAGAGCKRGYVHGKSDRTGSSPVEDPVHPTELLASIYHAFGIDPETTVLNHLKQPRELVKAKAITSLFA